MSRRSVFGETGPGPAGLATEPLDDEQRGKRRSFGHRFDTRGQAHDEDDLKGVKTRIRLVRGLHCSGIE